MEKQDTKNEFFRLVGNLQKFGGGYWPFFKFLGFVPADCLVISNGVGNLNQGKAEISPKGRNDKRRGGGLKDDQLWFLPMLCRKNQKYLALGLAKQRKENGEAGALAWGAFYLDLALVGFGDPFANS